MPVLLARINVLLQLALAIGVFFLAQNLIEVSFTCVLTYPDNKIEGQNFYLYLLIALLENYVAQKDLSNLCSDDLRFGEDFDLRQGQGSCALVVPQRINRFEIVSGTLWFSIPAFEIGD